ncbi:monocarboxylate transporter 5-like isoform X2 [Crassostrea angulata]|uniref:monocarboxylate transporter 5-like isoform X2 n=1 Tax=Magallana angulata TaxID=2784310 RepID=UPI0022B0C6F8|nr:monocarboxylate transporter 5-like isoform X2 [Crassostrea angulata]
MMFRWTMAGPGSFYSVTSNGPMSGPLLLIQTAVETCTATISLFVIGGIKSFGVLLLEFGKVYQIPKSQLTVIQSITGFFFLSLSPFSNWLCDRYTHQRVIFVGGLLTSSGLVLSSFAPSIEVMYFTYGVLTGFGFGLSFPPSVVISTRQFNKRRGVANGINMAGAAVGGICVPILMQFLIDSYGLKGCMLILGAIMGHICPCALLLRPAHKYPLVQKEAQQLLPDKNLEKNVNNYHCFHDTTEQELPEDKDLNTKDAQRGGMNVDHEVRVQLIKNSEYNSQSSPTSKRHHKSSESGSLGASITAISSISLSSQNIPKEIMLVEEISPKAQKNKLVTCCKFFQNLNFSLFKSVNFILLMLSFFFLTYSYHSIFIILPSYGREQSLSIHQSIYLIPAFGSVDVLGRLIAGFINDKCVIRRKEIFILYILIHGVGYLLIPTFKDFISILSWCMAFGIFTGGFNGTFVIILVDCVGIEQLASAWGISCLVVSISMLINPVLSGGLKDITDSWSASMRVAGSFAIIAASLLAIENVIARFQRRKSNIEKKVQCDENVS